MSYSVVSGSVLDKIGSTVKTGILASADVLRAQEAAKQGLTAGAAIPVPAESGLPIMPIVLLGAAGLVAWMLLKKKK
jgi:hypothetical protein